MSVRFAQLVHNNSPHTVAIFEDISKQLCSRPVRQLIQIEAPFVIEHLVRQRLRGCHVERIAKLGARNFLHFLKHTFPLFFSKLFAVCE